MFTIENRKQAVVAGLKQTNPSAKQPFKFHALQAYNMERRLSLDIALC